MVYKRMFFLIMLSINIYGMQGAHAEETDQFTLPPVELQDIGPKASQALYEVLQKVSTQVNGEIQMLLPKAPQSRYAASQLALRQKDSYLADLIYKNTGPGIPRWLGLYRLPKYPKPISHKEVLPWKTVYWLVFSQSPLFVVGLAPTINMYGYYFGTDKLGHFFMMGHTYYKIYNFLLARGMSAQSAHEAMVTYGQFLEQSYLGTLINGVYSNADLSANYAGWKFYMNLAQSVKIGNRTLPPLFILEGNQWKISNSIVQDNLLKSYLSDNLNEAWNPCHYAFTRNQIRKQVKKRCEAWIHRGLTQQRVKEKLEAAQTWYGEEYGYWSPAKQAITLEVCFSGN